jgi:hypothetical protein
MPEGECIRKTQNGTCVIFIPGVLSDDEQAWLNASGTSWPQLLAEEASLAETGIYVFSYRADLFKETYSLLDEVDSIRGFFAREKLWGTPRVIFVCHSVGGIAARKFVVSLQDKLIEQGMEVGLYLVASPLLGPDDANAIAFFARRYATPSGRRCGFRKAMSGATNWTTNC